MYLIGSIGFCLQSAVTLCIYRVGKTYPARNHVYISKSIKNSNYTRTPRPVWPVGPSGWSCQTVYRRLDRSDRLDTPIRPVLPILIVNTLRPPNRSCEVCVDNPVTTPPVKWSQCCESSLVYETSIATAAAPIHTIHSLLQPLRLRHQSL